MLGMSLLSANSFAATKDKAVTTTSTTTSTETVSSLSPASTDLILREISKKQAELELKRINFEMQKMDLDIQDKLNKTKTSSNGGGAVSLPPLPPPTITPINPIVQTQTPKDNLSKYKIGSIYGFDGNLTAEIVTPTGDTNVVKVGSVLGEGIVVASISSNSVTLRDKLNRDYVLGVSSLASVAEGGISSPRASTNSSQESLSDLVNNFNSKAGPPQKYGANDYYKN